MPTFLRGARPSPRHRLLAAEPFVPSLAAPPQFAVVPAKLSMWGNDQFGDCVTAEEAFARACFLPEIFIPEATVIDWARRHGVLNGASLVEVLDAFQHDGFVVGPQRYNDGPAKGVDYTNAALLDAATCTGPIKIAIDADALPPGAGNQQGWFATKGGRWPNTDHCVSLSSYGPAGFLYDALKVALPSGLSNNTPGRLLFTWGTQGFVTDDWLRGTCVEAWARNPTTVGVPPLPGPTPPPEPPPGPTPPPAPFVPPVYDVVLEGVIPGALGRNQKVTFKGTATPRP